MGELTLEERIHKLETLTQLNNEKAIRELRQRLDSMGDIVSMRIKLDILEQELNRYKIL